MPQGSSQVNGIPVLIALILGAVACATAPSTTPTATTRRPPAPVLGQFDPASVSSIKLEDYPIVPAVSPSMREVYQAGLQQGNNPNVFAKLGDCMTENPYFLGPFSQGKYDLGEYKSLKPVIDQFIGHPTRGKDWTQDSFATVGLASASGFNIAAPLDSTWADPKWCTAGESPLACEYRVTRPSIAVIMFGTNDVNYTDAATYDFYLRTIISETLGHNIVPILNTFPTRPEDPQKSLLLNQIVVRVAQDYDVPLVNLNRALEELPNHGVNPQDTTHLTTPPDERVDVFTPENLKTGFTVRNLVTLQALEAVLKVVR
ncbi:MAG: SGNH/GDSL hydrolase family protein [Chloroflexi bacterium]|nr:SGNH/GDSL hydrolase family protein [Chloroflexota bacterium]